MGYSPWGHKESDATEHRIAPKNETIETGTDRKDLGIMEDAT